MAQLLVVADDLTGAHDCAARLTRLGGPIPTARSVAALRGRSAARALVLDAETRFLGPRQARWLSARAWSALGQLAHAPWRFQKLDSTLRGNPGAEVEGLVLASAAPWVAVLPAYPQAGRVTLGGEHFVHGVRILKSEYAKDPLSPARVGRPQDLFEARLRFHVPLAWVQGGPAALTRKLRRTLAIKRPRFVTFDCARDQDVDCIAKACVALGCRHFAGASALAGSLAGLAGGPGPASPQPPQGLRWLVLAGSVSAASFEQLRTAESSGCLAWFATDRAVDGRELQRAWSRGSVALSTLPSRQWLHADPAERSREGGLAIQRLVGLANALAPASANCGYLLTGGHTALRFFELAGLQRFDVVGEAQAGLALGVAWGPGGRAWVATKPGGFGRADLFPRFLAQVGAR